MESETYTNNASQYQKDVYIMIASFSQILNSTIIIKLISSRSIMPSSRERVLFKSVNITFKYNFYLIMIDRGEGKMTGLMF